MREKISPPEGTRTRGRPVDPCTRRRLLRVTSGTATSLALVGTASPAAGQQSPYGGYLSDVGNFNGRTIDRRGEDEVEITVGAIGNGGNFAFGPPAVAVDPGTTVRWRWNGRGGQHNVVAEDGSFESELTGEAGTTFERSVEEAGVLRYYCMPHKAVGMKGVVAVGDAAEGEVVPPEALEEGADGSGSQSPELSEAEWTFMLLLIGVLGYGAIIGLLPDIVAGAGALRRRLADASMQLHGGNDFRSRLVSSTVLGWATIGVLLGAGAVVFVALWSVTGSGPVFLAGTAAVVLVVALYAMSGSRFPTPLRRPVSVSRGGRLLPSSDRSWRTTARKTGPNALRVDRFRSVVTGWLGVGLLFAVGAAGMVGLWYLTTGGLTFVVGLGVVVLLVAGYAVSSGR